MEEKHWNYLNYLWGVLITAALVSLIKFNELSTMKFTELCLYYATSSAFGALSSFLFNLANNLHKSAALYKNNLHESAALYKEEIKEIKEISNNMKKEKDTHLINFFRDNPFGIFKIDTKHTGVLGSLIYKGLKQSFTKIQKINDSGYLKLLQEALIVTNEFRGVNRKPINWFIRTDGGKNFLEKLRDKKMDIKKRIFIISDKEVEEMEKDLQNNDMMSRFWNLTGDQVETYWVTETILESEYNIGECIEDFAIYDDLIIKYNQEKELDYKIVDKDNDLEYKIFEDYLNAEIDTKKDCGIFTKIVPI